MPCLRGRNEIRLLKGVVPAFSASGREADDVEVNSALEELPHCELIDRNAVTARSAMQCVARPVVPLSCFFRVVQQVPAALSARVSASALRA